MRWSEEPKNVRRICFTLQRCTKLIKNCMKKWHKKLLKKMYFRSVSVFGFISLEHEFKIDPFTFLNAHFWSSYKRFINAHYTDFCLRDLLIFNNLLHFWNSFSFPQTSSWNRNWTSCSQLFMHNLNASL